MMNLSILHLVTAAVILIFTTGFLRVIYMLTTISRQQANKRARPPKTGPSHMVIVLGSGGHTAEMMSLLRDIDPRRYFDRTYIISSGDAFSENKAYEIEKNLQLKHKPHLEEPSKRDELDSLTGVWKVKIVPRARKIHQPLYTTPFSAVWSMVCCLYVLYSSSRSSRIMRGQYPDVVITNGPATAVMVIFAAVMLKFFAFAPLDKMMIIYVESWARVKSLSLSGKILLWAGVCDLFMVQWENLAKSINGNGSRRKVDWVGFLVA